MHRPTRYILRALTLLSALLCVATVVLWVRGRHGHAIDFAEWRHYRAPSAELLTANVSTGDGILVVSWARWRLGSPLPRGYSTGAAWVTMFPMPKTGSVWQQSRYQACTGGLTFGGIRLRRFLPRTYVATPNAPSYTSHDWIAGVPYPWLVATFAVVPAIRSARRLRGGRQRSVPAQCSECGYDLRATPDLCPECGTPVARATSP